MNTKCAILAVILTVAGCTTVQDSSPAPAARPSEFRNLLVLPRDIPRDQLIATMRMVSRSLGVRCNHCHVVTATTPKEEFDFPSDAKEEKRVARVMMQMTHQINHEWLERVEQAEGDHPEEAAGPAGGEEAHGVNCWTCHRGRTEPETPPPPPAENAAPEPAR